MRIHEDDIVIVGAKRTAIGAFQGQFKDVTSPRLASFAIDAAIKQAAVDPATIDEAIFGCCLPAGLGQAPARQAVLGAGLAHTVAATTVNKMCGSGMKAVMLAHDLLRCGTATVAVAGGMESMSNSPYLLPKARQGLRMGHGQVLDHMFLDGLQDAYEGKLMGCYADASARDWRLTREAQDAFASESIRRAQHAVTSGAFEAEIAPVALVDKKGAHSIGRDETPEQCNLEKVSKLRPAFVADGTVTAANSSSISDGAAALVLMRAETASAAGLTPLARIASHATNALAPAKYTEAPGRAIRKAIFRAGWSQADVDLFEINEAFAAVTMIAMAELGLKHEQVNVNGGACALGHPIGASGARILVTLLYALRARNAKRGIASLCLGGGEATAVALELV
ncbi:acetyl-CoA C-acyltransferase [Paraburkholderia sediminicola]|uniref:acetyl-CoA C-acyltransferase n=1 Tax=Paraburkholderia sediminicola TaxID=458836 RepID=UPI0038BAC39C